MAQIIAGLALLAAGFSLLVIWWKSRRNPTLCGAMVESFAIVTSEPFARGMAGADILLSIGGILLGTLILLKPLGVPYTGSGKWVGATLLAATVLSFILTFVVAWLGRPKFLFPPHARDQVAPWREALQVRRDRKVHKSPEDGSGCNGT